MKINTKRLIFNIAGILLLISGLYEAIIDDAPMSLYLPLFGLSLVFLFAPLKEVAEAVVNKYKK